MSGFSKNTINMDGVNPSQIEYPDRSTQAKIYLDKDTNELMKLNYDGTSEPIGKTEVNIVQADAQVTPDGYEYHITIPNPVKLIEDARKQFEAALADKVNKEAFKELQDSLQRALQDISQVELDDIEGVQTLLTSINEQIKQLELDLSTKEDRTDFETQIEELKGELSSFIININSGLQQLKTDETSLRSLIATSIQEVKKSIPEAVIFEVGEITEAATPAVEIREVQNRFILDVAFPKSSGAVGTAKGGGGGLSRKKIIELIEEYGGEGAGFEPIAGPGMVITKTSEDPLQYTFTSTASGGSGFDPIPGTGITITAIGDDYSFEVTDYISRTEVVSISGDLQDQIDDIIQEGTTIESSGGSILVTQNGLHYNLEVASAPIQDHNELNNIQGIGGDGGYWHLTDTQYEAISGADLSIYATTNDLEAVSGNLQSQIDNIPTGLAGRVTCEVGVNEYTINHTAVDTTREFPVVSLEVASSSSTLSVLGIYERTSTSFKVVLSGSPTSQDAILYHVSTITDISGFALTSDLEAVSGGLDSRITTIESDYVVSADISGFATVSYVEAVSGNLQTQINNIEEEQTVVDAGSGISVIESPEHTWTVSVTGDYVVPSDLDDYTLLTTTETVSGGLDTRITAIEADYVVPSDLDDYTLLTTTETVSGGLDSRITTIESDYVVTADLADYTLLSTTETVSGNLQSQIDSISISGDVSKDFVLNGSDTVLTYDLNGLLATKTTSSGSQQFNYDITDNLISISGSGLYRNKSFTYDVDGNLTDIEVV